MGELRRGGMEEGALKAQVQCILIPTTTHLPSMLNLLGTPPARAHIGAVRGVPSSPHCCGGGTERDILPITWDSFALALAMDKNCIG